MNGFVADRKWPPIMMVHGQPFKEFNLCDNVMEWYMLIICMWYGLILWY